MSKKAPTIFLILGIVCFFMAQPLAIQAAALDQSVPFNAFLASWIDVLFYIFTVIFLSLGLSNLSL